MLSCKIKKENGKMVRQDILAGLKNALERGYSLDVAASSFTNAGYKAEEVQEAAAFLSSAIPAAQPKPTAQAQEISAPSQLGMTTPAKQPQQLPQAQAQLPAQLQALVKEKPKDTRRIILVALLIVIFLLLAGFLLFLLLPGFAELREEFFSMFG